MLLRELAARERTEAVERGDAVNVDREHMVDVVVHAACDRGELGEHRQEEADVVELGHDRAAAGGRLGDGAGEVHEETPCLGARAERRAPLGVGRRPDHRAPGERVHARPLPLRLDVEPQRQRGRLEQRRRRLNRDRPVGQVHAVPQIDGPRRPAEAPAPAAAHARPLEQEVARLGHDARLPVVVLHESLGPVRPRIGAVPRRVAQVGGDRLLLVEREAVAASPSVRVKPVADPPEQLLGRRNPLRFARDEHPHPDQLAPGPPVPRRGGAGHVEPRASGPSCPFDVPQPAWPALHVRLEQVDRASELRVPRGRLLLETVHEAADAVLGEEPHERARAELEDPGRVARDVAQIDQGGRRGEVGLGERQRLFLRGHLVADRDFRVPERIEQRVDERARLLRVDPVRQENPDVRVAGERDGAATEAPHRGDGQPLRDGDPRPHGPAELPREDAVEARRVQRTERPAVAPGRELPAKLGLELPPGRGQDVGAIAN